MDTLRPRELDEDGLRPREVAVDADEGIVRELEDRLARVREIEEAAELDRMLTAGTGGRVVELVDAIDELARRERIEENAETFETRLREAVLGSDREPANRRERRFLDRQRVRAQRRLR